MSSMTGSTGYGGSKIPKGYEQGSLQQFSPEQMQLFQSLFGQVGPNSMTSRLAGGDQSMFEQMEAPAMRQFQGLQGDIASRFSGFKPGAMSARRGSGFKNTLNQATSDFAQDLQSKRMDLQRQAIMDLMGMSTDLLGQKPQENFLVKKQEKKPWWHALIAGGAPIAGAVGGGILGSAVPGLGTAAGAATGYNIGNSFGQAFQ